MQESTNTFMGGMNQDLSLLKDRSDSYFEANNIRVLTDVGSSSGAIENVKGNALKFSLDSNAKKIIGWCTIRNEIILFITDGSLSYIYRLDFSSYTIVDEINAGTSNTVETASVSTTVITDFQCIYSGNLGFSVDHPIKAIGVYETDLIRKVYWTDNYNPLRTTDIEMLMNTWGTVDTPSADSFDIIPNFDHPLITPTSVGYGQLKAGKISYCCQLYALYGKQTCYTIPTVPILITLGDEGANEGTITGRSVSLTVSNINPTYGTTFNRIRIAAIHYTNLYAQPEIRIIYEGELTNDISQTIYAVDDGTVSLGTYLPEEFQLIGKNLFVCKDIETKDNLLFAANITDKSFEVTDDEFDARSYRFCNSTYTFNNVTGRYARVWESDGSYYRIDTSGNWNHYSALTTDETIPPISSGTNWSIPSTADCILWKEDSLNRDQYTYKYQGNNSNILGGSGKNIDYEIRFKNNEIIIDNNSSISGYQNFSKSKNGWSNSFSQKLLGYQRDEVYRFGINFFDDKGRESFTKWIGDIKFPHLSEKIGSVPSLTELNGNVQYACIPYITYTVRIDNNMASKIKGFMPVRCERKEEDKTILSQGSIAMLFYPTNSMSTDTPFEGWIPYFRLEGCDYYFNPTRGEITDPKIVTEFISPEISFLRKPNYINGSYLEWVGIINSYRDSGGIFVGPPVRNKHYNKGLSVSKVQNSASEKDTSYRRNIYGFEICETSWDKNYTINSSGNSANVFLREYLGFDLSSIDVWATHGTCGILTLNTPFNNSTLETVEPYDSGTGPDSNFLMNLKVPQSSQYNGLTYSSRSTNTYIPCNHFATDLDTKLDGETKHLYYTGSSASTYTFNIFGGDTYISLFCYLRTIWNLSQEDEHSWQEIVMHPVETCVNTDIRHGDYPTKNSNLYLQELSGSYISGFDPSTDEIYTQEHNCYEYNTVYSRNNNQFIFVPEPFDFNYQENFDTMTRVSQKKYNAEHIDNYTIFKLNDFNEADTRYGPINCIVFTGQNLIFFQNTAVGVWSVNDRSLISDNSGSQLSLGTGGILNRYDYISQQSGCSHRFGYVVSDGSLFYVDSINKKMYVLSKDGTSVSDVKGMSSWFKNNIPDRLEDDIINGKGIVGFKDLVNNEIIFTVSNKTFKYILLPGGETIYITSGTANTIVYNKLLNTYTSFYSFDSPLYINIQNYYLSVNSFCNIYVHNTGLYGRFYDVYHNSDISLIINPNSMFTKSYTNLYYYSQVFIDDIEQLLETITRYRVSNDYQMTNWVTISQNTTGKRKYRKWRIQLPRAKFNGSGVPLTGMNVNSRIVSPYVKVELVFDNSLAPNIGTRRLVLHDVNSSYIPTNR